MKVLNKTFAQIAVLASFLAIVFFVSSSPLEAAFIYTEPGQGPTVSIHSVVTGAEGTNALVQNMGSGADVSLKFTIPRGNKGASVTGPQGPAGAKGDTGSQGPAGAKGDTGARGLTGTAGSNGAPGAPGAAGAKGDTGARGLTGPQGPAGAKGDTGARGLTGTAGSNGAPGAPGAAGAKGDTGARGLTGTAGSNGAPGAPGAAGAKGDTGARGLTGPQGPAGAKGDTGARGLTGTAGSNGAPGAPGAAGAKGDTGARGLTGPQGPAGAKGDTGSQGPAGAKGDTGARGLTGTAGSNGAPGAAGAKGDTGARGLTGSQGPAGAKGDTGPQGPAGAGLSGGTKDIIPMWTGSSSFGNSHISQSVYLTNFAKSVFIDEDLAVDGYAEFYNDIDVHGHIDSYSIYNMGGISTQTLNARTSVTSPSFNYSSDITLKKNIKTIISPLEKIKQLRGVTFNWKSNDKKSLGLIAQEVEKVFPEIISTNDEGIKSVGYGNLVAPLIEAVKEQQRQIEKQEKTINDLQYRLNLIESKLNK